MKFVKNIEYGGKMMDDLEFIQNFSKITVASICEKLNISRQNVYNGRTSKENLKKIRKTIESEYAKLYVMGGIKNAET